jgi:hypothetical protein
MTDTNDRLPDAVPASCMQLRSAASALKEHGPRMPAVCVGQ